MILWWWNVVTYCLQMNWAATASIIRFRYIKHVTYSLVHRYIINSLAHGKQTNSQSYSQENATRPSARGATHVNQNNLHTEIKQMPQDHQQKGLHMSTRITYFLQACKCHMAINKRVCKCQPESLTFYKHHACKCHKTISKKACTCQPGSLTSYKYATRPSARGPAHVNQNHLHTESRQMPQDHQQEGLHMSTRITYILRSSKCHKNISKRACTCQPELLTYWDQANATRPSARPAHVNQNHLLPISVQMPQDH